MTDLGDRVISHLREVADLPDLSGTKYRCLRPLGHGGMGSVFLVEDTELGREAALKVVTLPDDAGDLAARLAAEARLLAQLEHPNIIPVHDAGQLADGRAFYVMKYVRGRRLDQWRKEGVPRPAMLRLFQRVCGAVAFAHAHGVIHRDLKPDNIMIGAFGEALVMDWGVARVITAGAPPEREEIIGTPEWMAPEQARGEISKIDARTDVHALGAILLYLLDGMAPAAPGVPKALRAICDKALSADPAGRYESAREMSDDIERYLDGLPVTAHRETLLDRAWRLFQRHQIAVLLILAYLLTRALIIIFTGR